MNRNMADCQKTVRDLHHMYRLEDISHDFPRGLINVVSLESGSPVDSRKFYRVTTDM